MRSNKHSKNILATLSAPPLTASPPGPEHSIPSSVDTRMVHTQWSLQSKSKHYLHGSLTRSLMKRLWWGPVPAIIDEVAGEIHAVIDLVTGEKKEYRRLLKDPKTKVTWDPSMEADIDRLVGTDTIRFVKKRDVPKGRKVVYLRIGVDIWEHQAAKERVRIIGGVMKLNTQERW